MEARETADGDPASSSHGDAWFEWVTHRRPGGRDHASWVAHLAPVRDAVLAHANVHAGDTLLDVGAGDGLIAFAAAERVGDGGRVIFSDLSVDLLAHSAAQAGELGLADRFRFVEARAEDLTPIADGSVDVVTTRSVLIYVSDKAAAFRTFHRVLRPGGRVSIYEPINALMNEPNRMWSYDMSAVAGLYAKVEAIFDAAQDPQRCSMLDFDEQDLLRYALEAGFEDVHLELHVDIEPENEPAPWDAFVNSAGNPLVPTIREAIDQALTSAEAAEFEAHLRPLVEQGIGRRNLAGAYLWATRQG